MDELTRSKEIWHIPKRGSVHQTVFMVHVLTWRKYLNKSWNSGKQESLASEMAKAGLTQNGKALTHQSVRTLLANLPKYLGFIFIDDSSNPSRLIVSDVGYMLLSEFPKIVNKKNKKLRDYIKNKEIIEKSNVFCHQMSKLIITNPLIKTDCVNILVFPFRLTLKLLLDLEYLDKEEIAYILFHVKSEDEYPLLVERIKNFRTLSPEKRSSEIDAYSRTLEGRLTLVKAPSSIYYIYLCLSTGLCEKFKIKVNKSNRNYLPAIKLSDNKLARNILQKFNFTEIYNFNNDVELWKEYFTNPNRLFPPFMANISINSDIELLITIEKNSKLLYSDSIKNRHYSFPVFPEEIYKICLIDYISMDIIYSSETKFNYNQRELSINFKKVKYDDIKSYDRYVSNISEMFVSDYSGFDKEYYLKLKTLKNKTGLNYFDNYRKGGRLEYLFYELLSIAKNDNKIDEFYWFGKLKDYGLASPAPGGKTGFPDLIFMINKYVFILELTTILGFRYQWNSSEASSVPDHIIKAKSDYPDKNVIGIFSAPSIHRQLEQNLKLNAKDNNIGMIFIKCNELAEMISTLSRKELLINLLSLKDSQLNN